MPDHKSRIYYEKITGKPLIHLGEMHGDVPPQLSIEEEIKTLSFPNHSLNEIGCVELEEGEHWNEIVSGSPFRVNDKQKKLKFYKKGNYQAFYYDSQSVKKTYNEQQIYKFYYDDYVNFNLKQLILSKNPMFSFKWYSLDELNIRYNVLNKSWYHYFKDNYLKDCASDKTKLALDILENGTYWPIKVSRDPEDGLLYVFEGNHRILSAKLLKLYDNWDDNYRWFCIEYHGDYQTDKHRMTDLADDSIMLPKPIRQRMPFAVKFGCETDINDPIVKQELESRNGFLIDEDTIEYEMDTYYELICATESYPHWLRDIFYNFKESNGKIIKPSEIINKQEVWNTWMKA